jgi:hypothetical protein
LLEPTEIPSKYHTSRFQKQIVLSPPLGEQVLAQCFRWSLNASTGGDFAGVFRCRQEQSPTKSPIEVTNPGEDIMRIVHLACTLILLAAVLFCRIDGAAAQGSDAVRQACTPDAMRLCSDVIPDVPKVTACMKAKSSQLSEACRVAMRGESRTTRVRHHRGHYHHYRHCHHCG